MPPVTFWVGLALFFGGSKSESSSKKILGDWRLAINFGRESCPQRCTISRDKHILWWRSEVFTGNWKWYWIILNSLNSLQLKFNKYWILLVAYNRVVIQEIWCKGNSSKHLIVFVLNLSRESTEWTQEYNLSDAGPIHPLAALAYPLAVQCFGVHRSWDAANPLKGAWALCKSSEFSSTKLLVWSAANKWQAI